MIQLIREKEGYEIRENGLLIEEIEISFPLKKWPKTFSCVEEVHAWLHETERKQAKARAYWFLGIKSYSSDALRKKIEEKGYSSEVAETIIQELQSLGYLNDEQYWIRFIEKEFAKGYGPRVLEWKTKNPKLVRELITPAMQRKKIVELKRKGMQALARRGFDSHLIIEIFNA